MDAIKERPILFSAPMVRALLNGSKTQTRRIAPISKLDIKHHGEGMLTWGVHFSKPIKGGILSSHSGGQFTEQDARRIIASQFCPYGKPGDRLIVREAWVCVQRGDCPTVIEYAADKARQSFGPERFNEAKSCANPGKYRPSIHMPRWASRITLEIASVRIERLQDIGEADAQAEGVSKDCPIGHLPAYLAGPYSYSYAQLWDKINGPGSWAANPWVWVVEFRLVLRERAA